jgi:hypothetical protein
MKKSYQHIIKKSYTTPKIEEVEIDVAISLNEMSTKPPGEPEGPLGVAPNQNTLDSAPKYPTKYPTEYRSESPFGGSRPVY